MKPNTPNRSLLLHQNPIIFYPDLAMLVGIPCAIVIQKLEFLLRLPECGSDIDDKHWIYNTTNEWREKYFPFWSNDTIERAFLKLEGMKLVESIQPEGLISRRKYYRITEYGYEFLMSANLPQESSDHGKERDDETSSELNLQCENHTSSLVDDKITSSKMQLSQDSKKRMWEERKLRCSYNSTGNTAENTNVLISPRTRSEEGSIQTKQSKELASARYRICNFFKRKLTTNWTKKEEDALRITLGTDEEDWKAIEAYYALRGQDGIFCRNAILTMLNNWPQELDKSRRYFDELAKKKIEEPKKKTGW